MNSIDGFRGSLDNETSARLRYISVAHGVTEYATYLISSNSWRTSPPAAAIALL